MARIKIKDLPRDMKISREEMKMITGGWLSLAPSMSSFWPSIRPGAITGTAGVYTQTAPSEASLKVVTQAIVVTDT